MKRNQTAVIDLEILKQITQYVCSPEEIASSPESAISKAFEWYKEYLAASVSQTSRTRDLQLGPAFNLPTG